MAIHGVEAKIGLSAHEPAGKGGAGVIKHLIKGPVPVNETRLFGPEGIPILERPSVYIDQALTAGRSRFIHGYLPRAERRRLSVADRLFDR
jgi:hypothetical protein